MSTSIQFRRFLAVVIILLGVSRSGAPFSTLSPAPSPPTSASFIVQAQSMAAAGGAVVEVGGVVTQALPIINGVVATLPLDAVTQMQRDRTLTLYPNAIVRATGELDSAEQGTSPTPDGKETTTSGYLLYPAAATGAHLLHSQTIPTRKTECKNQRVMVAAAQENRSLQGWGVTVAFVDSGLMQMSSPGDWKFRDPSTGTLVAEEAGRCIVYRDFLPRSEANANAGKDAANSTDQNGHGTHVISTVADNRATALAPDLPPTPVGVAPQINIVAARALDKDGAGTYGDVIAAINWIVSQQATYNIRVLNLSLYAPVTGPYWADPLNQAVMKAWQAGITVVAAAGNNGPGASSITVPGNVPYIITAGAIKSGRYTISGGDELATYSSRGPTESAFVKPDILVPASRTIAPMPIDSTLAQQVAAGRIQAKAKVDYKIGTPAKDYAYYQLSGTSMASAEISGIVALMLQASPTLTNDQAKFRLMTTARPAVDDATGAPAYTVWEQGAGLVDAAQAMAATTTDGANAGMNIAQDLDPAGTTHYWGYTTWNAATNVFQLNDPATDVPLQVWDGGTRTWAGGNRTWAGGNRTWAGGNRTWAGGNRTWAGGTSTWASSDSLWAGGNRAWAGSTPATSLSTASHSELLLNDDRSQMWLPLVKR